MLVLWLDDVRNPKQFIPQYDNVVWVKHYNEFVQYIQENSLPDLISFDHDLGDYQALYSSGYIEGELPEDEKTGYDCIKWLIDYCIDNKLKLPECIVHSANPVGKKNIESYIENYKKNLC